jgi:hypothetical protein
VKNWFQNLLVSEFAFRIQRYCAAYFEGVSDKVAGSWRPALDPFNANPLSPVVGGLYNLDPV